MESILRNVGDIEAAGKRWLESFLGQSLNSDQRVFIMVLDPGSLPDGKARDAARAKMELTFAQTDAFAREHGITAGEADAAVEEAMNAVRNAQR
jgi:hypothetical protein